MICQILLPTEEKKTPEFQNIIEDEIININDDKGKKKK